MKASGTEGYGESADALVKPYESLSFADVHREILPLIPTTPSRVLDVGAGTGRDAAALAAYRAMLIAMGEVYASLIVGCAYFVAGLVVLLIIQFRRR